MPRCEYEVDAPYWGGCEAPARFHVERPDDDSYGPADYCPTHVGDGMAWMLDGIDVPLKVTVYWDESPSALLERSAG